MSDTLNSSDLVSIIVPVYNRVKFLNTCLESLLCQSWKNIEIIVVDDGSTDGSVAVLERIAEQDSRVKVIQNSRGGAGKARNDGLRTSRGTYLMFVDSDDYVDGRFVETMLRTLVEQEADIVQCCYARVTDGVPQEYVPVPSMSYVSGRELCRLQTSFVGMCTPSSVIWNKIFRRELWRDIWFDETHSFEDIFTSYQVIFPSKKVVLIPDVLYYWVIHGGSTSLTDSATEKCADMVRAWTERVCYFTNRDETALAALTMKRCCYVSAQHIYMLKKAHAQKEAVNYHRKVIQEYYPLLVQNKRWSIVTRFRLWLIHIWPELFGWYSKVHKLDFEK